MIEQWQRREWSRALELRALRSTLAHLRVEERTVRTMPIWERLARRSLVRARALAIAQLCEKLLADGVLSKEEARGFRLLGYERSPVAV